MQRDFGVYIPNGCKRFKVFLQLFDGNEANSDKPLKNKKISGIERLVLPFPDTWKYLCLFLLHKHRSIHTYNTKHTMNWQMC